MDAETKKDILDAIKNRGESHKALYWEVFRRFEEECQTDSRDNEKIIKLRKVLLETFDSTVDDVTRLSSRLFEGK